MDPGELSNLVKVLLENNPTMSEIITSDLAINRLVGEIFQEADDDGEANDGSCANVLQVMECSH